MYCSFVRLLCSIGCDYQLKHSHMPVRQYANAEDFMLCNFVLQHGLSLARLCKIQKHTDRVVLNTGGASNWLHSYSHKGQLSLAAVGVQRPFWRFTLLQVL
jgi:hypothetical protein